MRTILLTLILLSLLTLALESVYAQILPIDHNMKNLKVGNTFIYRYRYLVIRVPPEETIQFFYDKVIRHDTINNKVYAVFQNGMRERADSSGVYWIPNSTDKNNPFTKEYLRYPLFTNPRDTNMFLVNIRQSFMDPTCFPSTLIMQKAVFRIESDTNTGIFGIKSRLFYLDVLGGGRVNYFPLWGPSQYGNSSSFYVTTTALCGALIEGKYYGDSACLVASSTPLQRAEFATLAPSLAPNPVSDIATLRFILPTAQGVTIEMYDVLGREVAPPLHFEALSSGMNALPIEMASLPRGVYAVRLRTALGLRATTMMVKE